MNRLYFDPESGCFVREGERLPGRPKDWPVRLSPGDCTHELEHLRPDLDVMECRCGQRRVSGLQRVMVVAI